MLAEFWWVIFPVAFYILFYKLWMDHAIKYWILKRDWVVLEIIPPREIERGPKMMESFFQGFAGVVVTIYPMDKYLQGKLTHFTSLELVGEEGRLHFYIRVEKQYRKIIEAQLYAQYPDIEITEVEDYVKRFPKLIPNRDWNLWGADIQKSNPDIFPIKTYDKFEESVTGEMLDPMAAMAEAMQKLGPGQHIWLQFIIQPLIESWNKTQFKEIEKLAGRTKNGTAGFVEDFRDVLSKLWKATSEPVEFKKDKKDEQPLEFRLTPVEKDRLKEVEENLGQNFFKTKMRLIYLGRREGYSNSYVPTFFGTIKQFSNQNINGLKPHDMSKTSTQYFLRKSRMIYRQRRIYRRYRDRDMDGKKVLFSSKELASMYHFPDMHVKSPSIPRIDAKRGSAPANLPIS